MRVLPTGENYHFKNIAFVLGMISLSKGGKKKEKFIHSGRKTFHQSDLDGSQDVPTEWNLIRRDIPEGVSPI